MPAVKPGEACDLAVLVHEFPKLSETFVLGDLLALEKAGIRLHVFSLRRPQNELAHDDVERLKATVEYLPEIKGRQLKLLLRATQATLLLRDPRRCSRGLAEIYVSSDYSRLRLQQALLLARRLDQLGSPPLYVHFAHRPATVGRFAALLLGLPFAISAHAVDLWTSPTKELRAKFRDASVVLCCYREAQQFAERLADGHTPAGAVGVSVPFTDAALRNADAVMVVTDHSSIDYSRVCHHAQLVIDTRNACARHEPLHPERAVVAHA